MRPTNCFSPPASDHQIEAAAAQKNARFRYYGTNMVLQQIVGDERSELSEDTRLVAGLRNGNEAAFEEMVRKFGPRLLATARRYLRSKDDALDALQDAFLCAFKSIHTYRGNSQLITWLYRIVINSSLMHLRANKHRLDEAPAEIDQLLPRFDRDGNSIDDPSCEAPTHKSLDSCASRTAHGAAAFTWSLGRDPILH